MAKDAITIEERQVPPPVPLFGMTPDELRDLVESLGQAKYRAAQLADALYKQRINSLDESTTLPVDLRAAACRRGL